jgi:hypothetical protein
MHEYRHSAGAQPCFRIALYAPAAFLAADGLPFVRAGAGGWPTAIAPGTFDAVRCGSCGVLLSASDVTSQATLMPILTLAERRAEEGAGKVRLTRALLASDVDRGCLTAKQIADYLAVDPRGITAAMESGEIPHAFRVGRRGGVGEWRCPWPDGRHYIARLEARATDPAA